MSESIFMPIFFTIGLRVFPEVLCCVFTIQYDLTKHFVCKYIVEISIQSVSNKKWLMIKLYNYCDCCVLWAVFSNRCKYSVCFLLFSVFAGLLIQNQLFPIETSLSIFTCVQGWAISLEHISPVSAFKRRSTKMHQLQI